MEEEAQVDIDQKDQDQDLAEKENLIDIGMVAKININIDIKRDLDRKVVKRKAILQKEEKRKKKTQRKKQ